MTSAQQPQWIENGNRRHRWAQNLGNTGEISLVHAVLPDSKKPQFVQKPVT
jgi:hypothetical protein